MRHLLSIAITLMGLLCPAVCFAADSLPRSVLVIDQSAPNTPWSIAFGGAFRSVLTDGSTAPIATYSEMLDFGRFNGPQYEEHLRIYLREKYRDKSIDVIVVYGSAALEFLLPLRAEMWATVPVVFVVAGESSVARLNLPPEITGTILQLTFRNVVRAARTLVPNLKQIALVGDPLERQPFFRYYVQELPQFAGELKFIDLSGLPMADVRQRVATLPDDAAILFSSIYVDGAGVNYVPREALGLVAEVANRPIVSETGTYIGYGSVGGFVVLPEPIGQEIARITLRILDGEMASNIPITLGDFTRPVFDWRQLQRFGISEAQLPPGSEIRFRPVTMWEQYRWQMTSIFAALLVQAAMISWLLLERRRRHFAELESRSRLREVIHLDRVAAVGVMSASIAHELNQPLGAILANAETAELLLGTTPVDHDQLKAILADIRQSDQHAADIIAHLRGLLKKQSESELQGFDLNDAIQDALHTLEPEARRRGVLVSVYEAQGALPVRADQVHLEQVIFNLATNAMDAMQDCTPGTRKMTLTSAFVGESEVEVSVSDSGTGIPNDKLKGVFETFYTTKQQGTGLGLSIVRTILETYGGKIWAENRRGGGAVFRFTLPLVRAQAT